MNGKKVVIVCQSAIVAGKGRGEPTNSGSEKITASEQCRLPMQTSRIDAASYS